MALETIEVNGRWLRSGQACDRLMCENERSIQMDVFIIGITGKVGALLAQKLVTRGIPFVALCVRLNSG